MLQSIHEFWNQAMAIPAARWVMVGAGFLIVLSVCFYFFNLVRNMALGSSSNGLGESTDYLTDFRKLKDEGKLNEEEFSRLKNSIPTSHSDNLAARHTKDSPKEPEVNILPKDESE